MYRKEKYSTLVWAVGLFNKTKRETRKINTTSKNEQEK